MISNEAGLEPLERRYADGGADGVGQARASRGGDWGVLERDRALSPREPRRDARRRHAPRIINPPPHNALMSR